MELPSQYRYIASVTGINKDTSICHTICWFNLIFSNIWDKLKFMNGFSLLILFSFSILALNQILNFFVWIYKKFQYLNKPKKFDYSVISDSDDTDYNHPTYSRIKEI